MSTAKTGLTVPFIPADSTAPSKAHRSRKRNNHNNHTNSGGNPSSNNHKKIERTGSSSSIHSHNGLNNSNNQPQPSGSGRNKRRNSTVTGENDSGLTTTSSSSSSSTLSTLATSNSTSTSDRPRGYLANRPSRLDQESMSRRDHSNNNINNNTGHGRPSASASSGRLYDPKRDPLPVVPSTNPQPNVQGRHNAADPRNLNANTRQQRSGGGSGTGGHQGQQGHQRLYDPNQAQPQSIRQGDIPSSPMSSSAAVSSSLKHSAATPTPSPADGLARLTRDIHDLEKKVMEKPGRRTLDSDDESTSRQGGNMGWNRRIDNSKRLASKYLKLMQLDFKTSLKHDIDTRCWKLAIYPLIEAFRAALRDSEQGSSQSYSESDDDLRESIRHYFTEFISFAQEFYETLMVTIQKLEAKHATLNGGLSKMVHPPRWHRCVGTLGDLARYRWLHKLNDETQSSADWLMVARHRYREAIDLGPGNGRMYNQLALLSGGRGLESLYYYSKSLTVRSSFMNARETLMSFFSANEQIRALQALSLKQNAKDRRAALATTTLQDCEASLMLLHAMLFEKINLDNFEKRHKNFIKRLKSLHQARAMNPDQGQEQDRDQHKELTTRPGRWDGFYFMIAVINIAALYEFNWGSSVIAKSNAVFGPMKDHLATVATFPYASKLMLSTMEQSMQRYLTSVGDRQKVISSTVEEQMGWLIYAHVVLIWMASKPFGSGANMKANWLLMADHESLPNFWTTLVEFMNYHWSRLTPFDQSDMLSAISDELPESVSAAGTLDDGDHEKSLFQLSSPALGHEWELRGLAWLPTSRYNGQLFKGSQPELQDSELKAGSLWSQDSCKTVPLSKRIAEISLIAALHMEIIEFDFCENAFKLNEDYAATVQEYLVSAKSAAAASAATAANLHFSSVDEYSTDDTLLSSHTSVSQEESGFEDEGVFSDGLDLDLEGSAEILELKSKRDQLKSLWNESAAGNRQGAVSSSRDQQRYGGNQYNNNNQSNNKSGRHGRVKSGPRNSDQHHRRHNGSHQEHPSQRVAQVGENSTLVIDTNCLVADWTIVQRLVKADRWTVIIPLAVITELDGLKNNPAPLGPAAAGALAYLEGCIASKPKPRRLKIQTSRGNYMNDLSFRVESFHFEQHQMASGGGSNSSGTGGGSSGSRHHRKTGSGLGTGLHASDKEEDEGEEMIMRNHNVDDFILGLCLWHQEHAPLSMSSSSSSPLVGSVGGGVGGGIFLVTDDRNLRVKARARSVEVLGKEDIQWMAS